MPADHEAPFQFEISLSVLNHLGRNLYRNFVTVLGEAISNSWDADAKNVWIEIDRENSSFSIKDDGDGMDASDFQNKFLKIGYSKRKKGGRISASKRPYIGAKGIGKLALLSCAKRVSIFSKTENTEYVGGVIDNRGLDKAITNDILPQDYPLETLDFNLLEGHSENHNKGTLIVFEETNEKLRNSDTYIKKLLAMSFKFSLLDKDFTIYVNGAPVTIADLKDLSEKTEFVWLINEYKDAYLEALINLKGEPIAKSTPLDIKGFVATVKKPRDLKIAGTDERATIDLFVNGRLRERNITRHIPTQRIVENYVYGQIHFDIMDREGVDPFTSSREGVVEDDLQFNSLLDYLKRDLMPRIIDEWDKLRLDRGQEGDDENTKRLSKKSRKARDLFAAAKTDFEPEGSQEAKDLVERWQNELQPDATFNLSAYVDCFLSENLVRKFILHKKRPLQDGSEKDVKKYRGQEEAALTKANINFEIRKNDCDLSYLGMEKLVIDAEGAASSDGKLKPLVQDAQQYAPARNAVGHTGLLTQNAKNHLNLTFENIKGRLKKLLSTAN